MQNDMYVTHREWYRPEQCGSWQCTVQLPSGSHYYYKKLISYGMIEDIMHWRWPAYEVWAKCVRGCLSESSSTANISTSLSLAEGFSTRCPFLWVSPVWISSSSSSPSSPPLLVLLYVTASPASGWVYRMGNDAPLPSLCEEREREGGRESERERVREIKTLTRDPPPPPPHLVAIGSSARSTFRPNTDWKFLRNPMWYKLDTLPEESLGLSILSDVSRVKKGDTERR